ncbi:hypothetical protein MHYP_G00041290 [Metynnis hypsauchen]
MRCSTVLQGQAAEGASDIRLFSPHLLRSFPPAVLGADEAAVYSRSGSCFNSAASLLSHRGSVDGLRHGGELRS